MEENDKDKRFFNKIYLKISNALKDEDQTIKGLFYIFCVAIAFIGTIFLIEIGSIIIGNFIEIKNSEEVTTIGIKAVEEVTTMGIKDVVEILGPFGDFFGGMLNPILTFCSFMALLMTIILQQKELKLTREQVEISVKELGETRKATEISSEALLEQSKSLKTQNFENTFFNMINLHNNSLSNIKVEKENFKITPRETSNSFNYIFEKRVEGREVINHIFFNFLKFQKEFAEFYSPKKTSVIFEDFIGYFSFDINHYFRNIYQILKFIDNSYISNKKIYSNILRAQLSSTELGMLFFNSICKNGNEKLLPLLIKYEFLEHTIFDNKIIEFLSIDIEDCIIRTKELNKEFPINKIFGDNIYWKKYINDSYTSINKVDSKEFSFFEEQQ
ncbi:hypothetical protein CKA55_12520 [Arcobacter suis]|uniref:PutAbiC domain-containing protein n=1 Tax=Arcobacter suis CECT 7833 TaxID=663365 RepID=A0AAD0WQ26_9BACT|nr:putative phage abortive infection protein [Arcobacter suis]AXX89385.1 putAbiC domain-containing protein [Arcobacter suis CECT 7833]RWS45510.1 hypothetical protein CKA55_12520 [Arcobacter suis]